MRVVFMGTPDFAVGALEAIVEAGHEVAAVVTQPDKPKGRGKEVQMTPVKVCALAHDIPVFQPVKIKEPEAVETLHTYARISLWWRRSGRFSRRRFSKCRSTGA